MEAILRRIEALERRLEYYVQAYLNARAQIRQLEQKSRDSTS